MMSMKLNFRLKTKTKTKTKTKNPQTIFPPPSPQNKKQNSKVQFDGLLHFISTNIQMSYTQQNSNKNQESKIVIPNDYPSLTEIVISASSYHDIFLI